MNNFKYDIVILGAGASGLLAGANAGRLGVKVAIIDHANAPGRKILVAGGGKCNFTNRFISHADYAGENTFFTRSALAGFPPEDFIARIAKLIPIEERTHGQMFCKDSAADLLKILVSDCAQSNCAMYSGHTIVSVKYLPKEKLFQIQTEFALFLAKKLIVALGSCAWPQIGATSLGYHLGTTFGHALIAPRPALVGLQMPAHWFGDGLEGIAIPVSLFVHSAGKSGKKKPVIHCCAENLNLLFTHKGISGPAVLQASLMWEPGDHIFCQFLDRVEIQQLLDKKENAKLHLKNLVRKILPVRLAEALTPVMLAEKKVAELSKNEKALLIANLSSKDMTPVGTEGFRKAEVVRGGISTQEISSKTFESKLVEGLFFCGEVLDITGRLGGFNLHWAFASGQLAGKSAAISLCI